MLQFAVFDRVMSHLQVSGRDSGNTQATKWKRNPIPRFVFYI